jgi:FixJ family two-component response regulator
MTERTPIVYVVDDDEVTRNDFDAVLSGAHLTSRRVESASLFLEMYDPHQPGCLLLDIPMPGMTGIALQHHLNLRGALIPVIFVTGHAEVSVAVAAMLQGAFDFLPKPVANQALLACVRRALDHDADNRVGARADDAAVRVADRSRAGCADAGCRGTLQQGNGGRIALEPTHRGAPSRSRDAENRLTLARATRAHDGGSERRA